MGILDSYKLCSTLIDKAASTTKQVHCEKRNTCNVYIDGLSVWFLGYTNSSPDSANAYQKLIDILDYIRSKDYLDINSVTMYFNGKYPALKGKPISEHVQSWEVQDWSEELRDDGIVDDVEFLNVGEAEFECFFERDKRFASVIVTNDSNILPICYKYNRKTCNDTVFCYLTHRETFYDTNLLTTKLNKSAFTLLLFLRGSEDFIESLFSFSMVNLIFELLEKNDPFYNQHFKHINSIMRQVTEDSIKKSIVYFIWIIIHAKKSSVGNFRWPPADTIMEVNNYPQVMEWVILYSKRGKDVDNYNINFKNCDYDLDCYCKFHYILSLCKKFFPCSESSDYPCLCSAEKFKNIEHTMENISSDKLLAI
ncbi:GSCOCT00014063001.2-RA-CDS [Cotesia congregata]|uniref:Cc_fen1_1b n=1 Tax=Cotesia congregata TaxID=51543 RepID=A0A8J2HGT1_COTCN|nr:GSCOCT00014063001.2-RA-CDS [Cotesia congregata]CAG5095880.1 Cc_fen1_1b [Cotesia congregata]